MEELLIMLGVCSVMVICIGVVMMLMAIPWLWLRFIVFGIIGLVIASIVADNA